MLGNNIEHSHETIKEEFPDKKKTDSELMVTYGITFDGERYHYMEYRYDKLLDAVNYAMHRRLRGTG